MDQSEYVQIEQCEVIADEYLIQASEKYWVKAWLQISIKYRVLYENVELFIVNLPASNLVENGF